MKIENKRLMNINLAIHTLERQYDNNQHNKVYLKQKEVLYNRKNNFIKQIIGDKNG